MLNEVFGSVTEIPFKGKIRLTFDPVNQPLNELEYGHSEIQYITLLFTMSRSLLDLGKEGGSLFGSRPETNAPELRMRFLLLPR